MAFELEDFDDLNKMLAAKRFADQFNHYITVVDRENRTVLVNEIEAKACGFNTSEEIMSNRLTTSEMRCPIVELAETLHAENKDVIDSAKPQIYITSAIMADKKSLCLGQKIPIKDFEGKVIGVNMLFSPISHNPLVNLTYSALQAIKRYNQKNIEQFSFVVSDDVKEANISPKEAECLFYLLRGKSCLEIALILKRSPRTVEKHIEALKLAFNCTKKSELIEKALDSGCLNYIPQSFIKNIPKSDCIL